MKTEIALVTYPKLTMTLLVRNEADILAENIRYHHSQGIDSFIVMDNLSTDATPEIIHTLSQDIEIDYLLQEADDYNQRQWVTEMAHRAVTEHGADWILHNDADEFWLPETGDLRSFARTLTDEVGVVQVPRHNAVVLSEEGGPLQGGCHPSRSEVFERNSLNAQGKTLPGKVMHRACMTAEVHQGNHGVSGVPGRVDQAKGRLLILHFPYRSLERYKEKIRLGGAAYERNTELPAQAGATWRAHYAGLENGVVEHFWRELSRAPEEVDIGLFSGALFREDRLCQYFAALDATQRQQKLQESCETLCHETKLLVEDFARSQAELIDRVPRPQRWERPMYYNLRFAIRSAEAHLQTLQDLTSDIEAEALVACFPQLRDAFSLFPRNHHFQTFLATLLEVRHSEEVARLRADCAGRRVILHTSCHPRIRASEESIASFDGEGTGYHHIVLLGSAEAVGEQETELSLRYDGRFLHVPAPDSYEGLHQKLFYAYMVLDLLTQPEMVIKIDDNILLKDGERFGACLDRVAQKGAAYAGRRVGTRRHQDQWHGWHLSKCADPLVEARGYQYPLPRDYAAGGYGYVLNREGLAACGYMYLAMKEFFAMPVVGLEDACVGHAIYAQRLELLDISQGYGILAMPGLITKERQRVRNLWEDQP